MKSATFLACQRAYPTGQHRGQILVRNCGVVYPTQSSPFWSTNVLQRPHHIEFQLKRLFSETNVTKQVLARCRDKSRSLASPQVILAWDRGDQRQATQRSMPFSKAHKTLHYNKVSLPGPIGSLSVLVPSCAGTEPCYQYTSSYS